MRFPKRAVLFSQLFIRTHIPQVPVRLQTAPTGLGTPKLTHKVRFPKRAVLFSQLFIRTHIPQVPVRLQTAPTGSGTPKLTHKVQLGKRTYRPENRTNPVNWVLVVG